MTAANEIYEAGALGWVARLPDGTEVRLDEALRNAGLVVMDADRVWELENLQELVQTLNEAVVRASGGATP